MRTVDPHKSSLGNLDANLLALLAYIASWIVSWIPGLSYFSWLAPLVLFFVEKNSAFVRFNAIQAFCLQLASAIVSFVLTVVIGGIIGLVSLGVSVTDSGNGMLALLGGGGLLGIIVIAFNLVVTVFTVLAMYYSYKYYEYRVPVVANLADRFIMHAN